MVILLPGWKLRGEVATCNFSNPIFSRFKKKKPEKLNLAKLPMNGKFLLDQEELGSYQTKHLQVIFQANCFRYIRVVITSQKIKKKKSNHGASQVKQILNI